MSFLHSIPTRLPRPLDTFLRRNLRKNRNHIPRHEGTQSQITTTQGNFSNNIERRENATRYAKNIDTHEENQEHRYKLGSNLLRFLCKTSKNHKKCKKPFKKHRKWPNRPKNSHQIRCPSLYTPSTSRPKCRNEEYKHTRKRHTRKEHTWKGHYTWEEHTRKEHTWKEHTRSEHTWKEHTWEEHTRKS